MDEFNALEESAAVETVLAAAKIPSWAASVVAGRPYADSATLIAAATAAASEWTHAEVEEALADHPRIGEKHSGGGASAQMSSTEQSGVDHADADILARLAEGNRRYEERFGRIYLVRAKGRSAVEMLELLDQRLTNDPDTELEVTSGQLTEIAALRLEALFA